MTIAVRQQKIFAAIEATYNSAATIAGADVIQVENLSPAPAENVRIIERLHIKDSLAPEFHQYGGSMFGLQFDVEVKGSGTAGTAPRIGRLLQACGFGETVVVSTSVTYEPSSDFANHKSLTIHYQEGPNKRLLTGCRGSVSFNLEAGNRIMASFTFMGHISSEAEAAGPAESVEATLPPPFLSAAVTAGGDSITIGALSIDVGNTVGVAPDPNDANGYGAVRVTERRIAGSVDPEALAISTKDFIAELRAATAFALNTGVLGSAGNQVAFSLPNCGWTGAGYGDREALLTYDMPFAAYPTAAGDDDLAIAFT